MKRDYIEWAEQIPLAVRHDPTALIEWLESREIGYDGDLDPGLAFDIAAAVDVYCTSWYGGMTDPLYALHCRITGDPIRLHLRGGLEGATAWDLYADLVRAEHPDRAAACRHVDDRHAEDGGEPGRGDYVRCGTCGAVVNDD